MTQRARLSWPLRWLAATAVAVAAAALTFAAVFWRQDDALYDFLVGRWHYPAHPSVVLIAIDDRSLEALGQWPWPRDVHARLLDRLTEAGVRNVALDMFFSEPDRNGAGNDQRLAEAMRRNGKVILPVTATMTDTGSPPLELLPRPELAAAAATLAHSDIEVDADGVARGLYLRAGLGEPHWPALGAAIAGTAIEPPGQPATPAQRTSSPYVWSRDLYVGIRYADLPGTFPQVSYVDVLEGRVPPDALHDRRVIVGLTATGVAPRFLTPTSREVWMSGTEYQANVASMLLSDKAIVPLSRWQQVAAAAVLLLVLGAGMVSRWRYLPAWLVVVLGVVLIVGANVSLLHLFNRWFPPTGSLDTLGFASLLLFGSRILRLQNLVKRDSLTGLGNRHRFDLAMRQEVKIAKRSGRPLTLLLIDVDHFKRFNDTLGHHAGDLVLTRVATAITGFVRPRDVATRFGGDEFALILPDTTREGGIRMALSLLAAVRKLPVPGDHADLTCITVTIGLHSRVPDDITTPREIFDQADLALYQAKTEGRDRYCALSG